MTDDSQKHTLGLSTAQVAGSALAAITTAFVASWAGTAGTLIGAALGSVVATVGTATYTWSIKRTSAAVRRNAHLPVARVREERPPAWYAALPWGRLGIAAAVAAVVALAGITVVEAVGGKPVSAYTGGSSTRGTTLGHATGNDPAPAPTRKRTPTPTPSPSPSPSEPSTPVPTPTQEPTPTPSPSVPVPTEQPSSTPTTP